MSPSSILCKCTLKTSFTAVISSGPTPSPGTIVTLKVASARAGGVSGLQRPADTLSGREANCGHLEPTRPWRRETKVHLQYSITKNTAVYYKPIYLLSNSITYQHIENPNIESSTAEFFSLSDTYNRFMLIKSIYVCLYTHLSSTLPKLVWINGLFQLGSCRVSSCGQHIQCQQL